MASRSLAYTAATGRHATSEQNASSVNNPSDEQRRAANGYLVWPLALANIVREGDGTTLWARLHARQALVLGIIGTAMFLAVLALPLVAVIAVSTLSNEATIAVYGVGLAADVAVAGAWVVVGLRYAARAARGELFAIPVVTAIADRFIRRGGSA